MDFHQPETLPPMGARHGPAGSDEERDVLAEVRHEARALVPLDIQPVDPDTLHDALGRVLRPAEREHLNRPATCHERLRLAPDTRVLLVIGVDDHADRAPRSLLWVRTSR